MKQHINAFGQTHKRRKSESEQRTKLLLLHCNLFSDFLSSHTHTPPPPPIHAKKPSETATRVFLNKCSVTSRPKGHRAERKKKQKTQNTRSNEQPRRKGSSEPSETLQRGPFPQKTSQVLRPPPREKRQGSASLRLEAGCRIHYLKLRLSPLSSRARRCPKR